MTAAMKLTPELQEELIKIVRQELERDAQMRRSNLSVYRNVCKEFDQEMQIYNSYHWRSTKTDGTEISRTISHRWDSKIKDAIGTLLRAMYHVEYIARLPASAEPEMRAFIGAVLGLMAEHRPAPDSPTGQGGEPHEN